MKKDYLDKRFELIKKMDKNRNYSPSPKELEEAYGYLRTCLSCGKKITIIQSNDPIIIKALRN